MFTRIGIKENDMETFMWSNSGHKSKITILHLYVNISNLAPI